MITRTVDTAADLMVGDILTADHTPRVVTRVIPATSEDTLALGEREVQSGLWRATFNAAQHVDAEPGLLRLARLAEQAGQVPA